MGAQQRPGNRVRPSSPMGMDIQAAWGQRARQVTGSQPGPCPSSTGRATAPGSATAWPLPGSYPCRIHLYDRNIAKSKIKLKSKHLNLHHSRKRASSLFFFFFSSLNSGVFPGRLSRSSQLWGPMQSPRTMLPHPAPRREVTSFISFTITARLPRHPLCPPGGWRQQLQVGKKG